MKLNQLFETSRSFESLQDPEIVDAAKAVGTSAELTDNVYKRVIALMTELKGLNDGDLTSKLSHAKGEEKFAMRVALKVIQRRVDENEPSKAIEASWQILSNLTDKEFDYDQMEKFLSSQKVLSTPYLNKNTYRVDKNSGIPFQRLMTALKKASGRAVKITKTKTNEFQLDWDYSIPIKGEILYDSTSDKSKIDTAIEKATKLSSGTGGGKGWYMKGSGGANTIIGKFIESDLKGEPFSTSTFKNGPGQKFKAGEIVNVTVEVSNGTLYGNVKVAKI